MKTPIQKLIEKIEALKDSDTLFICEQRTYQDAIEIATQMLDKEKEVIQRAYKQGVVDECGELIDLRSITEAEEYYNRTFNTKEK